MKSYKLGIITVIIFFSLIYLLSNNDEKANCYRYNEFLPIKFNGLIINKYLDSSEHLYPTIIVKQIEKEDTLKFYLIHEKSNLYSYLKVGDKVVKEVNKNKIRIIRHNDTINKIIDFGCKENSH